MPIASVPRTAKELAELEASYRPFQGAEAWSGLRVDAPRWTRFAHTLARRRGASGESAWAEAMERLLRAAALDSTALDGLFPANPELTTMVFGGSISRPDGDEAADPTEVVAECHRRALVLASEAAADGRTINSHLIAVLQDVITESQATYSVTTEHGDTLEVDLPRRQYKPVSNYLPLPGGGLAVFAPASLVAAEMERPSAELSSRPFAALHPAVQAAYAHYALTAIHPFADGNGRLARTIASIFLIRSAGVPLIVFAEQWPGYYQALNQAKHDDGAVGAANGSTSGLLRRTAQARTSRRNMLRRGGVVAAASVAGLTLLDQRRAEAVTGGGFVLGQKNDANNPTQLHVTSAGTTLVPLFHIDGSGLSGTSTAMIVDGPGSLQGIGLRVNGNAGGTGIIASAAKGPKGTTGLALAASGSNGADAIHASSDKGAGVAGGSTSGKGVTGTSSSNTGVAGTSSTGNGVTGKGKRGGVFAGSAAAIQLTPHAGSHPASGSKGDLFVDHNTHLWFCRGGTAWVKLA